jgi:hypothetical protein
VANLIALVLGSLLVIAGRVLAGRLAGLGITAVCSMTMAYLMPPVFSFRVSGSRDILTLALYGAIGAVLSGTPSARRRGQVIGRIAAPPDTIPPARQTAKPAYAVGELLSAELIVRAREAGVTIDIAPFQLTYPQADMRRILSDVLTDALETPGVRHISLYGGHLPGGDRVFVAAHRVWPPRSRQGITIGRCDNDCTLAAFSGWPLHACASWFDNGSERIYQISLEDANVRFATE